eukprot:m.302659 g.302659  ORF g.302659 m.302659 type:complete len:293 (-) comp20149_c0_seq1:789-1667(-)
MSRRSSPRKKNSPVNGRSGRQPQSSDETESEKCVRPAIFEDLRDSIMSDRLEKFIFALEELQTCLGLHSLKESISMLPDLDIPPEYREVQHALHFSCRSGSMQISKKLLEFGVNPDSIDESAVGTWKGCTPLHLAANQGHADICAMLLANGADVQSRDAQQWTPIHHAARAGCSQVLQLVMAGGASVSVPTDAGINALHVACRYGHTDMVLVLLRSGLDANTPCRRGYTPLHYAVEGAHADVIDTLIDLGVTVRTATPVNNVVDLGARSFHTVPYGFFLPHISKPEQQKALS